MWNGRQEGGLPLAMSPQSWYNLYYSNEKQNIKYLTQELTQILQNDTFTQKVTNNTTNTKKKKSCLRCFKKT